jgi:hypothetical protein
MADNLNIIFADIYPACRWKMVQRRGSRKGRGKGAKRKNGRGAEMEEVGERDVYLAPKPVDFKGFRSLQQ